MRGDRGEQGSQDVGYRDWKKKSDIEKIIKESYKPDSDTDSQLMHKNTYADNYSTFFSKTGREAVRVTLVITPLHPF